MPLKGSISIEHTMWCGYPDCNFFDQHSIDTKRDMERIMKSQGWRKTSKFGWLCPSCVKAERKS